MGQHGSPKTTEVEEAEASANSGPWMDALGPLHPFAILATWSLRLASEAVSGQIVLNAEGPEHVQLYFRDDGIIIFDFPSPSKYSGGEIPKYQLDQGNREPERIQGLRLRRDLIRDQRARYVNGFLACFNAGIKPTNAFTPPLTKANYMIATRVGSQWGVQPIAGSPGPMELSRAFTVPIDDLQKGVALFDGAFGLMGDTAYDLLGLLYRAAFQCWQHDFEGSLTLAWAVIEKAQNVLWDRFLTTGYQTLNPNTKISGKRRDLLKEAVITPRQSGARCCLWRKFTRTAS